MCYLEIMIKEIEMSNNWFGCFLVISFDAFQAFTEAVTQSPPFCFALVELTCLILKRGWVSCICKLHIGQFLLVWKYFTMQLLQTRRKSINLFNFLTLAI